jgi:multisubunit Na+/H+ antiporter MnhG subunit
MVCMSPVISYLLLLVSIGVWPTPESYLTPIIQSTELNIFIVAIQLLGLSLYFIGRRRGEPKSKHFSFIVVLSGVLVILGAFMILMAYSFYYGELLPWSLQLGVRPLVIWDHLQYFTWGIQGVSLVMSGLAFLAF